MPPKNKARLANILAIGAAIPVLLYGYATGPDAGVAGVPGETTCAACHSGSGGSGSVTVAFPAGLSYTPGVKQRLVVTIADSAARRWGFELTARRASSASTQAGTLSPADSNTQLVCTQTTFQTETFGSSCPASMPLAYVEQTNRGSSGSRFEFDWTPPATDAGNIVIYIAANAANGDGRTSGDHIYTQRYTVAPAQANAPTITSVVNAASFQAGISAGSWVTITGANLAGSTRTWRADEIVDGVLPVQLDDVSVTIDGLPAFVSYISPTQINAQAPSDSSSGPVSVVVTHNGAASASATAQLQPESPAFFLWSGKYPVVTRADYSLVAPADLFAGLTTPARPGDVIILWGTGFGPTNPAVPAGRQTPASPLASLSNGVTVTIGGSSAQVVGTALSPGAAGLYQIAVQVPDAVADGEQAVVATINGIASPDGVVLSVQR